MPPRSTAPRSIVSIRLRSLLSGTVALVLVVVVGCALDDPAPALGRVWGSVTWQGKPLPGAVIFFQPKDGHFSAGTTDEKGRYVLDFDTRHPGALLGHHKITLLFLPGAPSVKLDENGAPSLTEEQKLIEKKFSDTDRTPLEVEIKPGVQEVILTLN